MNRLIKLIFNLIGEITGWTTIWRFLGTLGSKDDFGNDYRTNLAIF